MKSALLYVFLVWITTIIVSPLIYYYAFGHQGLILFEGSEPDRQLSLMFTYPLTLLLTLPGAAILVFVAAIINRELENPPLKKMLVGLSGILMIILSHCFFSKDDLGRGWDSVAVYCGVLILSSLVYKLKPD